jgi:hypothetical protein
MNPTTYLHIQTQHAPKTGQHSHGNITYALLKDIDHSDVYFTLLGNDGTGYYSHGEIVPFATIQRCLEQVGCDKSFSPRIFREAWVGKSSNNAGFLVAGLKHLGLISAANDASHHYVISSHWEDWKASILAQDGEPYHAPQGKPSKNIAVEAVMRDTSVMNDEMPKPKGKKSKKLHDDQGTHPVVDVESSSHADPT